MKKLSRKLKQADETSTEQTTTQMQEQQYCLRCGRKLKSKEAKERGMGKICYEKLRHTRQTRLF